MERPNELTNEVLQSLLLLKHRTNNTNSFDSSQDDVQDSCKKEDNNIVINDEDTTSDDSSTSISSSTASSSMENTPTSAASTAPAPALDTIPSPLMTSSNTDIQILRPNDKDILSGRGTGVNAHPGNVFFRDLIQANREGYFNSKPPEKKLLIKRIVEATQANGHRFLKLHPMTEMWTPLTFNEARRKTAQALRENASVLKKKKQAKQMKEEKLEQQQQPQQQQQQHGTAMNSKFAMKRKLDDIRLESQEMNKRQTLSISSQVDKNKKYDASPKLPGHIPPQLNQVSQSLSMRLKILKEKQTIVKQLEKEINTEQRALMRDLLAATQLESQPIMGLATYNTPVANESDFLQSMKRSRFANDSFSTCDYVNNR